MLEKYKTDMTTKGVDPTNLLTKLEGDCDIMVATDATQEQTKTALREHTDKLHQDKTTTYTTLACGIDMVIAAFGRTSERGQEATGLRRQLTKVRRRKAAPSDPSPRPLEVPLLFAAAAGPPHILPRLGAAARNPG